MKPGNVPDDILLRLSLVDGVAPGRVARLLRREGAFPGAGGREEGGGPGPGRDVLRKAVAEALSPEAGSRAARVRDASARIGARIVGIDSDEYPPLLRSVPDAPLILYRIGESAVAPESVAVVGSRAPTAVAADFARILSADLAAAGWTVVSGLARGIDAAAHEGALKGGGRTIAVLGCGVDVVYPPGAERLRDRVIASGAVLSEYPPGTRPFPGHFPARNRLISGLSRGVVVVEAASRSGALITARCALEQGREVMAVPGNPLFPHTAGSNGLLRDGAAPVTGAADVLAELGWGRGTAVMGTPAGGESPGGQARGREREILGFLATERHVNDLAEGLGLPVRELLPCLLDMELRKLLERMPGDYYKKISI
ncbi:MAG: DNA-processing protein DprA [Gemmatimonadota bacterium]